MSLKSASVGPNKQSVEVKDEAVRQTNMRITS